MTLFASNAARAGALLALALCACSEETPHAPEVPPTVDEDRRLGAVELSSTRLRVHTVGKRDGDVIIVLHGGPGDDYRYMLRLAERAGGVSLADEHRLIRTRAWR